MVKNFIGSKDDNAMQKKGEKAKMNFLFICAM
jgi:hypothetical protein